MGSPAPQIYLVTDRLATGSRGLVETVKQALTGITPAVNVAVQLREKDLGARALVELARQLRSLTRAAGARLFVNDRVDVAIAVEADGVHLGVTSFAPAHVKAMAPGLQIAVSTHAIPEVHAAALGGLVDFVVFGPVFETPSKRRFGLPPLGLGALSEATRAALPVIAIGGIDGPRARQCLAAGACGIACIREVMSSPTPALAMRELCRLTTEISRHPLDT